MSDANADTNSNADADVDADGELPEELDDVAEAEIEAAKAAIEASGSGDRPDPADVAPATKEDVLNQRDDGEEITDTVVVEMTDGHRTMEFGRPSATLIEWFEQQGEDIGTGEFAEVYARLIEDPDLTPEEWRNGDLTAYVDLIGLSMQRLEAVMQSEFVSEASDAIESRSDATQGN